MKSILAIEDDPSLLDLLKMHLKDIDGYLDTAQDGVLGLDKILNRSYDLIILDVMLPKLDGFEICKKARAQNINTPILMLTAKSEEIDKILGLEIGADDYVVKPFSIRELIARVKALLRRASRLDNVNQDSGQSLDRGEMTIELEKRKVTINGNRIELSPKEFELLAFMAQSPGVSYSRTRLLNTIWGYDFEGFAHTVNSHINRLRTKIEVDVSNPQYILTTWGVGYRFNEDI